MRDPRTRTVLTLPSSDQAFAAYVQRVTESSTFDAVAELEARLRSIFPNVVVRSRGLSGDSATWYVYREGRWVDDTTAEQWDDEDVARIELDAEGFIVAANEAAGVELALPAAHLRHRHVTDFAVPGTLGDVLILRQVSRALGGTRGTIRHLAADGTARIVEHRSTLTASGSSVVFRPVRLDARAAMARPIVRLDCLPAADGLFARIVHGIVSRMPEPAPDGLELRLRRSYPYATVTAIDQDRWLVWRDTRSDRLPVGWEDPALARIVALDTSLIVEANAAALELLGGDLVGRHWQDLALPQSLDRMLDMREFFQANGGAESTFRLAGPGGRWIDYDYRLTWQGSRFTTVLRPFVVQPVAGGPDAVGVRVASTSAGTSAAARPLAADKALAADHPRGSAASA